MPQRGGPRAVCGHQVGEGDYDKNDVRSLEELGGDYNGLLNSIEDEVCAVEGLEGLQAEAVKGRSAEVHFC